MTQRFPAIDELFRQSVFSLLHGRGRCSEQIFWNTREEDDLCKPEGSWSWSWSPKIQQQLIRGRPIADFTDKNS